VFERLALFVGEFSSVQDEILSYRFAGIPAAPYEIQELFLLDLRLVGGDVRTIELYEPVAFDVMLHFFAGQLAAGPFQDIRR
jgi:hypothetical protein